MYVCMQSDCLPLLKHYFLVIDIKKLRLNSHQLNITIKTDFVKQTIVKEGFSN